MSRTHLRVFLLAFVVVALGATLFVSANNGDADATALAAAEGTTVPPTTTSEPADANPPADAEHVIAEAQQRLQAMAAAVNANEAEQAAQAEQAQQLVAFAQAQAEADAAARAASSGISDGYWDRMANCETGGNWSMVGSRYSGGLGFYNATWDAFGGREFAARAGQASREQQIIVANRVANDVGLTGWGCLRSVGRP